MLHIYQGLNAKVVQLDDKFNECFETYDERPVVEQLGQELKDLRDHVIYKGNAANGNMNAIQGEFDTVGAEFRLLYGDMDKMDPELRLEFVGERQRPLSQRSGRRGVAGRAIVSPTT